MPVPWPEGGPWVLATTSASVDWQRAAAALAAASTVRAAALVFGSAERPGELLLGELATVLEAGDAAADPLSVDEAAAVVRTLARTHGLVLVVGVPGLLVPAGRAGWTPMDLAVAVSAPVVVVTGTGPDAANHASLALGAVAAHGLAAAVITVGDLPGDAAPAAVPAADAGAAGEPGPGDAAEQPVPEHEAGMPVTPAGRVPAGALPDDHAVAARRWLHPLLHASAGRPKGDTPPPAPQPLPPPATTSGKRVVLLLAGVFVSLSLVVCGLAFCQPAGQTDMSLEQVEVTAGPEGFVRPEPEPGDLARPGAAPGPDAGAASARPVAEICPQHRGRVTPARPDRATTRRVNAAWQRIEDWLAAHAPAGRRSLAPPAAAQTVDAAQRRMSVAFPADLVASLRRHDGVRPRSAGFALPPFYLPMPVADLPAEWLMLCGVLAEVFDAPESTWWDRAFVPFASSGDGGNLLVDQRPGRRGRVGEFFNEEGVSFDGWPGSVAELLERTADSLETGRPYAGRYRPRVTADGALDWDIV
ncbi:hypothetical protein GCM10020358_69430 [Amorphoplanes nipponensis]|uniref:Knr4/Smi1-like domain-containing protein n=1 Tax=Actinoplanes nipponensis TaxID=135950 RepID=A0A919MTF9_9ACTN|nr:SMI1/KNR4 family protein [Actinoplanes nipponensis]GIE49070.1 hypothetical protein Ani05nite_26040 [Actinoplanes nipponensis]